MQNFPIPDATTRTGVLDRLALIIDAFEVSGQLTLSEVARITGLPRSSAHRMLKQLVTANLLRCDGSDYRLGIRLMELGSLAIHQDHLHSAAAPWLWELHRVTGLVVHLGILDASDIIYLAKIGGVLSSTVPTRVGARSSAENSALGRVLLAYRESTSAMETPPTLKQELSEIRETGISYGVGLLRSGVNCIAAPIGPRGTAIAAVSVSGPAATVTLDYRGAIPVRLVAASIWSVTGRSVPKFDTQRAMRDLRSLSGRGRTLGLPAAARPITG